MNARKSKKEIRQAESIERILDLQKKIQDQAYIEGAILRLAQVMSNCLVEQYGSTKDERHVRF